MRIHVKHLNFTVSASALSLLSPLGIFFSNHLAKVEAEEFFINFDCPKGRLQIEIKGNGKNKTGKWYFKQYIKHQAES